MMLCATFYGKRRIIASKTSNIIFAKQKASYRQKRCIIESIHAFGVIVTHGVKSIRKLTKISFFRPFTTKIAPLPTKTKVRFLNDVCQSSQSELYGKMMLAPPIMTASPNDAWLRHVFGANIAFFAERGGIT